MAALDYSRSAQAGSLFTRVFSFAAAAYATLIHWNEARQTRRALNALTDRELDDIGLVRGDINAIQ